MSWVSWEDLGAPPGGFRGAPRGVSRNPGACNLYVWGADDALWQRWWDGIWHRKWEEHGGPWASEPSPDSMHADQEQVFIRGPDGLVYQKSWWAPNTWSTWETHDAPPGGFRGAPHAISRGADLVNIYVWGADGRLWQRGHWFDDWHDWWPHEGEIASEPSPASRHVNSEHVYARGAGGHVVQKRFLDGSEWSAWTDLGEPPGGFQGAPQAIARDDAEMLYVWGNDGRLWRRRSLSDLTWTDWRRHTSAELASEPSLVRVGAGTEHIFVRGADGHIHWLRPEFDAGGMFVRAADLVVMGVRWEGMEPVVGADAGSPEVVAGPSGGRLIVTLPPQHIAEDPLGGGLRSPGIDQSVASELPVSLPPGSRVAGASTDPHSMQIFVVGDDERAHVNVWHDNWDPVALRERPEWDGWRELPGPRFPPGAPIAATVTGPDTIHLSAVNVDAALCTGIWNAATNAIEWTVEGGGELPTDPDVVIEVSRFAGEPVEAVRFRDVVYVFVFETVSGGLWCWRAPGGWLWPLPRRGSNAGSRVTAVSCSYSAFDFGTSSMVKEDALLIFSVNGEGQVRGESWNGAAWTSYELGAPDAQLSPLARLGAVDAGTGEAGVFAIAEDGGLWGLRWRWRYPPVPVGRWQKLGEGYEPGGSVTGWRQARGIYIFVLAVNAAGGVVETMVGSADPDGMAVWGESFWRDWFVPGSPLAAFTLGQSPDELGRYFAVQADRTVVPGWGYGQPGLMEPWKQWAILSGPSQLAVDLPAGTHVTLSSEGVLTALRDQPLVPAPAGFAGPAGNETVIEMPWGLFLALDAGQPAYLRHADRPRASAAIVELWHSWLGSHRQGDGEDAGQTLLRPAWPRPADPQGWLLEHNVPLFAPPLTHQQRTMIVEGAKDGAPVTADRVIFSSLGGWLTAGGSWPGFAWQHHAVVGRDLMVRTVTRGILFPFGHEAEYEEVTLRGFDEKGERSVAWLHKRGTLRIIEPVRRFSDYDASAFREFPFDEVEIALRVVADLDPSPDGTYFWPTSNGGRVRFPLRLRGAAGEVFVRMPLIFVKGLTLGPDADPVALADVQAQYGSVHVDVPAAPVALAADQVIEVHAFDFGPAPLGEPGTVLEHGLRPRIDRARVALPALRQFAPRAESTYEVTLESAYVERGDTAVLLRLADGATLPVDFGGRSDASGGVATPGFVADAISGAGAPVKPDALSPGAFFKDAKLLGLIPLEELLPATGWKPPLVRSEWQPAGLPPKMILDWNDVALDCHGVFEASADCRLALNVTSVPALDGPPRVTTTGSLTAFKLNLAGVLVVSFSSLTFTSQPDEKPALKIGGLDVAFAGDLQFLNVLQDAMRGLQGTMPVTIDASPTSITVSEHAELPSISLGAGLFAVTVSGAVLNTALTLPFDGEMEIDFSFGSRKHPFRVGVWILGGGGYLELRIRRDPNPPHEFVVQELLASVEIGGVWSLDWVVVKGEVHALAGIEIRLLEGGGVRLSGYVRVGGSVEALGLVSVSIEVTAEITAEDTDEMFHVVAAASVVIEIDLFLVSAPLELEQTIVLYEDRHAVPAVGARQAVPAEAEEPQRVPPVGAPPPQRTLSADEGRAAWKEYREAFAPAAPV